MGVSSPVCVSVVNMKGGVGKTTIVAHLCHEARRRGMRVLAVDLDPQANLSQGLIGGLRYRKFLDDADLSIVDLFKGFRPPSGGRGITRGIRKDKVVRNIERRDEDGLFHLVPARFNFSDVLIKSIGGNEFVLASFLSTCAGDYDIILIDCAPTESLLTRTAYHASRYVLVPVKPEFLATIGFPMMEESLSKFRGEYKEHRIDICGVVINDCSEYAGNNEKIEAREEIKRTAGSNKWPIYTSGLTYSRGYPKSLRQGNPLAVTSYPGNARWEFPIFADEFFKSIEL